MLPSFPSAIRNYLHNHQPIEDENALPEIFAGDKEAEQEFVEWAGNHPQIVERNPRLFKVLEMAVNPSGKMEVEAKNVNNLVLSYNKKEDISMDVEAKSVLTTKTLNLIERILADSEENPKVNIDRFPSNYAQTALALFVAGTIDWNQLLKVLSKLDVQGKLVVEYKGVLKSILPGIETQIYKDQYSNLSMDVEDDSANKLCDFLLMRNQNGDCPLLHSHALFQIVAPLIYKCLNSDENALMLLLSATNNNQDIPLHNKQIFEASLPLLRNLSSKGKYELFTRNNHGNCTIMNNPEIRKMSIELIEDMQFKHRDKLLRFTCESEGQSLEDFLSPIDMAGMKNELSNTPLHFEKEFKELLPDLSALPPKRLLRLLTTKNDAKESPLDNPNIFGLIFTPFGKAPGKRSLLAF